MDTDTTILLGVATLFIANHAVVAGPHWHHRRRLFLLVQLLTFGGACFMAGWGAPGFDREGMRLVNWMLSAMLIFHVIQNNNRYQRALYADRTSNPERERRRDRIVALLQSGEE